MPRDSMILEFEHASAPLRRAATEEVVMCRFDGVGPAPPIRRITVEYDDPRPRPGVVPNIDPFRGYEGQPPADHLWKVRE